MYRRIIQPLLFKMNIEKAHHLVLLALKIIGALPTGRKLLSLAYSVRHESLERNVFGLKFNNPIGLAAGFDTNGDVINEISALGFGFVEIGTITASPQTGNPKPRIFRLSRDEAIVNRIGQANKGWQYAIENLRKRDADIVVGCNIGLSSDVNPEGAGADYLKSFRTLYQYVDYFTVNITSDIYSIDSKSHSVDNIMRIVQPLFDFRRGQSDYRPIMLKISPDVDNSILDLIVDTLIKTPLDGIVAVAGTRQREHLESSQASISKVGNGRLSGRPLTKRAIEVVSYINEKCGGSYPIIGVGGMMTPQDVKDMLNAGASLVQLYSGFIFEGPSIVKMINQSLIEE